ncbi:MAG: hypothetical protein ACOYIF_05980 [Acetivibrionales bacterium]|jgi:hypothetical protein
MHYASFCYFIVLNVHIKGEIGIVDGSHLYPAVINVYGDGNLLKTFNLELGSLPQEFDFDVAGVTQLDFNINKESASFSLFDIYIK